MDSKTSTWFSGFVVDNAKSLLAFGVFICGLYIQYQVNMAKIENMETEIAQIKVQIDDQYVKLDNMKLDKAVFEANMRQISDMSTDIREIRNRLEEMLKDRSAHNTTAVK